MEQTTGEQLDFLASNAQPAMPLLIVNLIAIGITSLVVIGIVLLFHALIALV